jgi:sarcosine oxidase/L-pipecolate oxidase
LYNDSPDGDWVIGRFPADSSLILATAGSGHAYKFLPVIGRLVADLADNKLDPKVAGKFAIDRVYLGPDTSRSGPAIELDLDQLCTQQDLEN